MLEAVPPSADGLTVPLGRTTNGKAVYKSLSQMYSMLVGGTTGGGKSNLLNVMLCTLIRRNTPERLHMLMVDLKGGLEFGFYEGIPHLLNLPDVAPSGIVQERTEVPKLLQWLFHEGERRIKVLRDAGYKDVGRYNARHRKDHMPHILLIIDEWADIKLEPKTGKESEELLINISSRFRAVGIHVVLCTQVPKSEVLNMRVKGVLPAKIAFSCPHNTMSMAVLDNGHATNLQPAGRAVFQWQGEIMIQAPWINDDQVKATVKGAIDGHYDDIKGGHDVTREEVWRYALDNASGWLSSRDLYAVYRDRGLTQKELLSWLEEAEGKEIVIGTSLYRVEPATGSRSRRLVAVEEKSNA
jgi:S-DNA-T family DNA segregation ATPase FtsK/SpoIIIE